MTNEKKLDMMPAALWLANTLSIVGISIAGWVLITVSDLNAKVTSFEAQLEANTAADKFHHGNLDLHMPADRKFELFVSRGEYLSNQVARSNELMDLKVEIRRGNEMLTELLERISRMEGKRE